MMSLPNQSCPPKTETIARRTASAIRLLRRHTSRRGASEGVLFTQLLHHVVVGLVPALLRPAYEQLVAVESPHESAWVTSLPGFSDLLELAAVDSSALGWAYQFWGHPERSRATWAVSRRSAPKAIDTSTLAVSTQLYTDDYMTGWIARRMLDTSADGDDTEKFRPKSILDPACGAGHFLLAMMRARRALEPSATAVELLGNLWGVDIDPSAISLCRVVLLLEASRCPELEFDACRRTVIRQISVVETPMGTLDRAANNIVLSRQFDCVVANPPYVGRRKLDQQWRHFLEREYPAASLDLCAAFMVRCCELLRDGGAIGLVVGDKWLRLKGYERLRCGAHDWPGLYSMLRIYELCELGSGAFGDDAKLHDGVGIVMMTARKQDPVDGHCIKYRDLSSCVDVEAKAERLSDGSTIEILQEDLRASGPRAIVAACVPASALLASRRTVGDEASVIVGLQTNDDARLVRYHWELPPGAQRWIVHGKGGGFGKWFGLNRTMLNFEALCAEQPALASEQSTFSRWIHSSGWTYSWFANGRLGLREKNSGWSFGRAASTGIFTDDRRLVAYLNSELASFIARRACGKVQMPEGVVRKLPIPSDWSPVDPLLVDLATAVKRELTAGDPLDVTFRPDDCPTLESITALELLLLSIEALLEHQVWNAAGITAGEQRALLRSVARPCVDWRGASSELCDLWIDTLPDRFRAVARSVRIECESAEREVSFAASAGNSDSLAPRRGAPMSLSALAAQLGCSPVDACRAVLLKSPNAITERRIRRRESTARLLEVELLTATGHRWPNSPHSTSQLDSDPSCAEAAAWLMQNSRTIAVVHSNGECIEDYLESSLVEWLDGPFAKLHATRFLGRPIVDVRDGRIVRCVGVESDT